LFFEISASSSSNQIVRNASYSEAKSVFIAIGTLSRYFTPVFCWIRANPQYVRNYPNETGRLHFDHIQTGFISGLSQ